MFGTLIFIRKKLRLPSSYFQLPIVPRETFAYSGPTFKQQNKA